jgi:hypothetical protein
MTKTFTHWNFFDFKGYEVDSWGNLKYIKVGELNKKNIMDEKEIETGEEIKNQTLNAPVEEPEEKIDEVGENDDTPEKEPEDEDIES